MKSGTCRIHLMVAIVIGVFLSGVTGSAIAASPEEQRKEIRAMRSETLNKLYKVHPSAKGEIQKAVGYAVFSNVGINLILLSAAGGSGMAHHNETGKDTYMKMISGGFGFGLGVKDFRGIFVFSTENALNQFVDSGWAAEAQVDAAAKSGDKGGAVAGAIAVAPGVYLYQLTETGLALQATIQGTKYYKDDDLNSK
ncbi:MAG: YSC84-related protein [Gallionella sp.]|nr:YSC84-related protein [Gallionella sp.]